MKGYKDMMEIKNINDVIRYLEDFTEKNEFYISAIEMHFYCDGEEAEQDFKSIISFLKKYRDQQDYERDVAELARDPYAFGGK